MSFLRRLSGRRDRKSKALSLTSSSPVQVKLPAANDKDLSSPTSPQSNGPISEFEQPDLVPVEQPPVEQFSRPGDLAEAKFEPTHEPTEITESSALPSHQFPLHALISHAISAKDNPVFAPATSIQRCLDLSSQESSFLDELVEQHRGAVELVAVYDRAKTPSRFKLVKQDLQAPFPQEWQGHFDLVNATLTISQMPASTWASLFKRILGIIAPGGWLQSRAC
jgi:hypothetical protein